MIETRLNETRIEYLARVLHAFMQQNPVAAEYTIEYDGAECDGGCLAEDFISELNIDVD